MLFSFVTALYPIRDGYLSELAKRFQNLLDLLPPVPIYVWTDREWPTLTDHRIHWLKFPLNIFKSYEICMKEGLGLPHYRDPNKDTQEFMGLMNTKIEMLWRVIPHTPVDVFIWIDAGISKIFQNLPKIRMEFGKLEQAHVPEKILMPGCWNRGKPVHRDSVHWRFCGGYFIVPVVQLDMFKSLSDKWILALSEQEKRIMWEVNVWVEIENENPDLFLWYKADHNDSIVEAPLVLKN